MTDDVTNDGLIVILATRIRIMNPTNTNILSWLSLMHAILIKATIQYMDSIVLVAQPFSFIFCVGRRRWGGGYLRGYRNKKKRSKKALRACLILLLIPSWLWFTQSLPVFHKTQNKQSR